MGQPRSCRGHGHYVAVEATAVLHTAISQQRHNLRLSDQHREREAAGQCLCIRRQVRLHPQHFLCSAQCDPESGDNFVKYEQHAVLVAQLPHALHVAGPRHNAVGVAQDRLGEHARKLAAVLLEHSGQGVKVVPRRYHDVVIRTGCDAA